MSVILGRLKLPEGDIVVVTMGLMDGCYLRVVLFSTFN
jgi:hypothetical protein